MTDAVFIVLSACLPYGALALAQEGPGRGSGKGVRWKEGSSVPYGNTAF